nr:transglutaminase family protein [Azohydromonas aeria]
MQFALELNYHVLSSACDFVFNVHAAQTRCQQVRAEALWLLPELSHEVRTDPFNGSRYLRLHAGPGPLRLRYEATVDIAHHAARPQDVAEVPVARLPAHVLPYLYPSRYCQSDRLLRLAYTEFGTLAPGYARVQAVRDWVHRHVTFRSSSSDSTTSAVDTLIERVGVCRDFAHLMIALCRALNLPARFATGIDYGADPALGPTDFHAYVEVFLGDRWYLFDPSGTAIPMGFVRLGTGRDAADVAFATIFGAVQSPAPAPLLHIEALADAQAGLVRPVHCTDALSTDDGLPRWL